MIVVTPPSGYFARQWVRVSGTTPRARCLHVDESWKVTPALPSAVALMRAGMYCRRDFDTLLRPELKEMS